jgi:hypothetical protein
MNWADTMSGFIIGWSTAAVVFILLKQVTR